MTTLQTLTETNPCFQCCFCRTGVIDNLNYGNLFMYDGVVVHYFCMLFSAALSQHGRDDEGILGFLSHDIMSEVRRSLRLRCKYCWAPGASVGCCNKKCRTAFHYPCGLKNGANYQFFGNYESYCVEHVVNRAINIPKKDWVCPICTSQVCHRSEAIQSSCCGSAVLHKECLQKLALSSGYFFKCPMCNNGKEFVHEMRSLGIFVPEQDASWEREPNAYEELYQQHSECDVVKCVCPKGKSYSAQKGSWILARCRICGAAGTHKQCSNLLTVDNWACEPCLIVELNYDEKEKAEKQQRDSKAEASNNRKKLNIGSSEEEAYVSARSGNRKVRNGRLSNRPKPKNSNVHWKFSDLTISNSCYWYFPYRKEKLAKYDKRPAATLPDWRRLRLQVNLVNWIPKSFFENQVGARRQEDGGGSPSLKPANANAISAINSIEELVEPEEDILTPPPKRKRFIKRRVRRPKSKWEQGIIRRQRKYLKRNPENLTEDDLVQGQDDLETSSSTLNVVKPENGSDVLSESRSIPSKKDEKDKLKSCATKKELSHISREVGLGELGVVSVKNFEQSVQSNIDISVDENNSGSVIKLSSFKQLTEPSGKQIVLGDLCTTGHNNDTEGSSKPGLLHSSDSNDDYDSKLVVKDSKVNNYDEMLPLTELNKDVGLSPCKLSFLMSSQKGLIQETRSVSS